MFPPQAKRAPLSKQLMRKVMAKVMKGGGINYNKVLGRGKCGYGKRKHRK